MEDTNLFNEKQATYRENRQKLQAIADKLKASKDIDIDQLAGDINEATKAFQICKARLEAARAAIGQTLPEVLGTSADNSTDTPNS